MSESEYDAIGSWLSVRVSGCSLSLLAVAASRLQVSIQTRGIVASPFPEVHITIPKYDFGRSYELSIADRKRTASGGGLSAMNGCSATRRRSACIQPTSMDSMESKWQ